jgi:hypothetical protein
MKCILFGILVIFFSCSSINTGETVIASMNSESKPKWALQSELIDSKDGKIRFLGFEEVDGDSRISSALELSDYRATGELSNLIHTKFNKVFQRIEEGHKGVGLISREVGLKVNKSVIKNLRLIGKYWEKVLVINHEGEKDLRLRVYSLAEIKESDLKNLIDENIGHLIPKEIKEEAQNSFLKELKNF